jgi:GNAT superfamily N-acetyltransferase
MRSSADVAVESVEASRVRGLSALFERSGCPCFCRYWHFEGDKNEWLERCALRPEQSRGELEAALGAGSAQANGMIATARSSADDSTLVVGWMKLCPAPDLPKLYGQRLYRGLACFGGPREDVWTIGCLLVDEAWRRRAVSVALVRGGIAHARALGARAIEAFPRGAGFAHAAELWTGAAPVFDRLGFERVHDFDPYPVYRLML